MPALCREILVFLHLAPYNYIFSKTRLHKSQLAISDGIPRPHSIRRAKFCYNLKTSWKDEWDKKVLAFAEWMVLAGVKIWIFVFGGAGFGRDVQLVYCL